MSCARILILAALCVAAPRADTLFTETFEDTSFAARGWYDAPRGTLSAAEHIPGSTRSFECFFAQGQRGCSGGTPGRRQFAETESVLLSYWVKYSANYVGSQRSYHPHEFHFVTNKDDRWVGPSHTHLTTYTEQVGGVVRIALQDSRNNDTNCILLNNNSFVGCNGSFSTYPFTEARSACACNGLVGDLDGRDCFNQGNGTYYSARFWDSADKMFSDSAGPRYKNNWHFVECYFQMNTIAAGVGVPDGVIRYWYDGELVLDYSHILFRTGVNADMKFNQFLVAPYIGDGSPVDQYMWVDNLTVATAKSAGSLKGGPGGCRWDGNRGRVRALAGGAVRVGPGTAGPLSLVVTDAAGRTLWAGRWQSLGPRTPVTTPAVLGKGLYLVSLNQGGRLAVSRLATVR